MNRIELTSRRDFLGTLFSTGAMVLAAGAVPAIANSTELDISKTAWHPSVFLGLETDGSVIIVAHRSEMGTGIRTSLPMVVADELEADWSRVRVEQAIGDKKYGSQDTDGSQSIRDFYAIMRETGATARLMLERAAAAQWNVPPDECRARNHEVIHAATGKKAGFGELVGNAAKQPMPAKNEIRLKNPEQFSYIGKGVPIVDLKDICTGAAVYGFDARIPGMVYASIERPPVLGGKLKGFDDSEARKIAGVQQTVVIEGAQPPYGFQALGGVAVIADNTWTASQARKKLKIDWNTGLMRSTSRRRTKSRSSNPPISRRK